ncbi:YceI family protein [Sandaracinobacter sp. RS1-74]|uniref:YceI family protein n=1 Tax=Sandaracinobacteroides sayramensis TaxID=2913411 RepID=UPI001EDACF6A|nr:YceI family protein [Sandaracinobacteroides sayramensis]MCG2841507.1 YceI family protein [Sandaracinobacteroides sayramensis]
MIARVALSFLLAAPAAASQWAVVPAQSAIGFTAEWNGQKVEGRFPKFAADIRFDPAKPGEAKVDATIDLAAATTPDRTVNGSLPGADWFDVKKTPTARFQSTSITQVKPGQYLAKGTLTMRGVSVPVSLPFTLNITGDTAVMQGQTVLDRRSFRIGQDSDAAGTWVGFKVPVKVNIRATRVK